MAASKEDVPAAVVLNEVQENEMQYYLGPGGYATYDYDKKAGSTGA